MVSPILDKNKVEIANVMAFHLNANTDAINYLDKRISGIKPKAIIGYQARKKNWPANQWSSVWLFQNGQMEFPPFGDEWEFRHVYVDV